LTAQISDIGLSQEIIPISTAHPAAKNRYLLNPSTQALERVGVSLTGTPAPVRALIAGAMLEPFRSKRDSDLDESVAAFFSRRFGPAASRVASAFVHGIYAADPNALSVRSAFGILPAAEKAYGSVVLGMLLGARSREEKEMERLGWEAIGSLGKEREQWSVYALASGMQSLTDRLEARIVAAGGEVRLGTAVKHIERNENGVHVSLPTVPRSALTTSSRCHRQTSQSTMSSPPCPLGACTPSCPPRHPT
jgi:oxygen-dependent protoporphyrinogen oxidase